MEMEMEWASKENALSTAFFCFDVIDNGVGLIGFVVSDYILVNLFSHNNCIENYSIDINK